MLKYEYEKCGSKTGDAEDAAMLELTQRFVRQCCPKNVFPCEIAEKRIKGNCPWCTGSGCSIVDTNLEAHRAPKANMKGWKPGFTKRGVVEVHDFSPVLDDPAYDIREVKDIPAMDVNAEFN